MFFDTNILVDAEDFSKQVFKKAESRTADPIRGVICDFIEGEALNLRKGLHIFDELKGPDFYGYFFETDYNAREGSMRSLEDMPTGELKEAVLVEYDKKLDPSGMLGITKEATRASRSKSKFGDFSLLTVATISAFRRKRQSIIVSRDRWIKLSCKSLEAQFKLPIYCYDQWNFSAQEILNRVQKS